MGRPLVMLIFADESFGRLVYLVGRSAKPVVLR